MWGDVYGCEGSLFCFSLPLRGDFTRFEELYDLRIVLEMVEAEFLENTTGAYVDSGELTLTDGAISDNEASGVELSSSLAWIESSNLTESMRSDAAPNVTQSSVWWNEGSKVKSAAWTSW